MAGRIAGITIEIGGDTKGLQSSLKSLDGQLQRTQSALKDVNKLLKLDPGNTELLRQKQKQLQVQFKKEKYSHMTQIFLEKMFSTMQIQKMIIHNFQKKIRTC